MSDAILYFAAHFLLVVIGLPMAFVSGVREFSLAARISAAFGAGALAVTVAAIAFSAVGIPLSMLTIGAPLTTLSIIAVVAFVRKIKRERKKERER